MQKGFNLRLYRSSFADLHFWSHVHPRVSENKAIAIVEVFPTYNSLMLVFEDQSLPEKEKVGRLADVEIKGFGGETAKKIG